MLKLPTTSTEGDGENVPENAEIAETSTETSTKQASGGDSDNNISFGFHTVDGVDENVETLTRTPEGTSEKSEDEQTLEEVAKRSKFLAGEVSGLISKLQITIQDACELTHAHVKVQKQVCDEVDLIVETGVKFSEQLVSKVVSLSEKLDCVDELSNNVKQVEKTLSEYERIAAQLVTRRRARKALERSAS